MATLSYLYLNTRSVFLLLQLLQPNQYLSFLYIFGNISNFLSLPSKSKSINNFFTMALNHVPSIPIFFLIQQNISTFSRMFLVLFFLPFQYYIMSPFCTSISGNQFPSLLLYIHHVVFLLKVYHLYLLLSCIHPVFFSSKSAILFLHFYKQIPFSSFSFKSTYYFPSLLQIGYITVSPFSAKPIIHISSLLFCITFSSFSSKPTIHLSSLLIYMTSFPSPLLLLHNLSLPSILITTTFSFITYKLIYLRFHSSHLTHLTFSLHSHINLPTVFFH